jgi:hypothetical protein
MQFKAGDRVVLDEDAGINKNGGSNERVAAGLRGRAYTVQRISELGYLVLDGNTANGELGYLSERFKHEPVVVDDLDAGYVEACSSYRACADENGKPQVEAMRVKIIARCADMDEAERIAAALNAATRDEPFGLAALSNIISAHN